MRENEGGLGQQSLIVWSMGRKEERPRFVLY